MAKLPRTADLPGPPVVSDAAYIFFGEAVMRQVKSEKKLPRVALSHEIIGVYD